MFLLNLILALLREPMKRLGAILGLEAGPAQDQPAQEQPAEQPPADQRPARAPEGPNPMRARGRRRRPARRDPAPAPPPSDRVKEVDEEPVLTAEFAEEGAEDGAGAEVHVEEPWEGYGVMKVPEITSRLASATTVELAAVQLYEGSHRKRASILRDVERRMRTQQV
jgi:hypothetical protein